MEDRSKNAKKGASINYGLQALLGSAASALTYAIVKVASKDKPTVRGAVASGLAGAVGIPLGVWGIRKLLEIEKQTRTNYASSQSQPPGPSLMSLTTRQLTQGNPRADNPTALQGEGKPQSQDRSTAGVEDKQQKPIKAEGNLKADQVSQDRPGSFLEGIDPSKLRYLGMLLRKSGALEKFLGQTGDGASKDTDSVEDPRALRWLRILSSRPRVLILGGQGTGKSCLAFWLLEIMRGRGRSYAYMLPEEGRSSIPDWLGIIQDLSDAPPRSIVLVDEAYLSFFSRDSQTRANREITKIVNLARQKDVGLIFVAHESRHLEKNILSGIDTLVVKKPAPLQVELDRSFLRPYLLKAQSLFQGKTDVSAKIFSYVCFSPSGFQGMLENPKPSFWSEKLSHIFASGNLGKVEKPAQELTREEKKERARKLHDYHGYSYGEIAKQLGIGKTTVYRWLNDMNGVER